MADGTVHQQPGKGGSFSGRVCGWAGLLFTRACAMMARDRALICMATLAFIARTVYVFVLTDYESYVVSDMGGYWYRAEERFNGFDVNINQFVIWPPLYHIILTGIFRIIDLLGMLYCKLEIVIIFHIILAALSIFAFYYIAIKLALNRTYALAATLIYAFFYPLIYLNAFILTENFSIPLLVCAVAFVFADSRRGDCMAAVLLALSVAVRPALGPLGLAFFAYVVLRRGASWRTFLHGALFSAIFFALLGGVVAENYRISEGRLRGISAGSGVNFFFAVTRTHRLDTVFSGYTYVLVPPDTVDRPENGWLETEVPPFDQGYYYRLGWDYLKAHPERAWQRLFDLRGLFWGPLFPTFYSAYGSRPLLFAGRLIIVSAFALLVLLPFGVRPRRAEGHRLFMLVFMLILLFATYYVFNSEHRYIYPAFVIVLLIDCALISDMWPWKRST